MTADHLPDTRPEGQQLCPVCWPEADPREYAVLLCSEHGPAREARTTDDARFEEPFYASSSGEGDGVTGRAWAALLHRPYDRRRK